MGGDSASLWRLARPEGTSHRMKLGRRLYESKARVLPVSSRASVSVNKHLQPEFKEAPGPYFEPGAKPFVNAHASKGEQDERTV